MRGLGGYDDDDDDDDGDDDDDDDDDSQLAATPSCAQPQALPFPTDAGRLEISCWRRLLRLLKTLRRRLLLDAGLVLRGRCR